MKFITLAAAFALVLASTANGQGVPAPVPEDEVDKRSPEPEPEAEPMPMPIDDLDANKHCYISRCPCNSIDGKFCGDPGINNLCTSGHMFECFHNGGQTCDWGVSSHCN